MDADHFPFLESYAAHREYGLKYIQLSAKVTREKAKHAMLVAMFGGKGEVQDPFIQGFKDDLRRASKLLETRTKTYGLTGR